MSDTAGTEAGSSQEPQGTEENNGSENTETPTVEELLAKVEELTGHSRKWEDRAKANADAKKELDKIRREAMTEAERVEADKAAHELTAKERDEAVAALARYKVAIEFGLSDEDVEALASVSDEKALRSLAERLSGRSNSGTRPNPAQGKRGGKAAPSTPGEAFADALSDLF